MGPTKSIIYSFDTFRMDVLERRLWHDDELVSLTPKAFDTLLVLLENKGRIVDFERDHQGQSARRRCFPIYISSGENGHTRFTMHPG